MISKFIKNISNNPLFVLFFLSVTLSLFSLYCFYNSNLLLAFGDATSHLNISRRVVDNITPGAAQLGGVWLPLLHVFFLTTIWNDFMWRSGLSGSLINIPLFILSIIFMYKLVYLISNSKLNSFIAGLILLTNVNFLYMQTTAMTETLLITGLIISVYYLYKWSLYRQLNYLLLSGIVFALSSLNRYEAWPVCMFALIYVLIYSFIIEGRKKSEGLTILFGAITFLGIFFWLIWQSVIFNNPLYFLGSEYSSKEQTLIAINKGLVLTYKNIFNSLLSYFYALVHVNGLYLTIFGFVGVIAIFIKSFRKTSKINTYLYFLLLILFVPGLFLTYALYTGHIPMNVPELKSSVQENSYFNIRYALFSLPALIVFSTTLAIRRYFQIILVFLLMGNLYSLNPTNIMGYATIQDALGGRVTESELVSDYIMQNHSGGKILISETVAGPIIINSGLKMKDFITEGSQLYWSESLSNPLLYSEWVIISNNPRDMVGKNINYSILESNYSIKKDIYGYIIYIKQTKKDF
jgi:hypothetical protein